MISIKFIDVIEIMGSFYQRSSGDRNFGWLLSRRKGVPVLIEERTRFDRSGKADPEERR